MNPLVAGGAGCPPIDPDPVPPPLTLSRPDAAFQIPFCLTPTQEQDLAAAVRDVAPAGSDVRSACRSSSERIGIWFRPIEYPDNVAARNAGLAGVELLATNETFAALVSSAAIARRASDAFSGMPKRLDGSGQPNPSGPVHLQSIGAQMVAPNQVVGTVHGFDERPFPDVDFTLKTTDTLSSSGGLLHCASDMRLDVDTSFLHVLTGFFGVVVPPLGLVFGIEDLYLSAQETTRSGVSLGCPTLSFFPYAIKIPGGLKIVVSYSRAQVIPGLGVVAGGTFNIVPRTPVVGISGQRLLAAYPNQSAQAVYSTLNYDLREPLTFSWTSSGTPVPANAPATQIFFPPNATSGSIAVDIVDADNLRVHGTADITIGILNPNPPPPAPRPPPPRCPPPRRNCQEP